MKPKSSLAKLSRPRLSDPLPRERLFAELDRLCQRPVIGVIGPPGAGKTTLVASYLEAREISGLWYQVDAGDADAATFFFYLRQAADDAAPGSGPSLQLLTPEYMSDLAGFSRRFFRDLYARFETPAVLVFDNFQDVPEDSAFVTVIREGLAEVPDGVNVILCSRADPLPDFARFVLNERMGIVDWSQLRLSLDEVRRIAHSRVPLDDALLRELHAHSDGWAAGVTLMLEHAKRTGQVALERAADAKGTVFNYFAGEIFNRAAPRMQQLLLRTACSGRITVGFAEQITGDSGAGALLEELYRRHYFTYRRTESEPSYVYHALFREFLLQRARELWSRGEVEAHNRRAAALLEGAGETDSAVGLYLEGAHYEAATQLILREAGRLLASGRWQTLGGWMRSLPSEHIEAEPWLLYWWGTSLIPVDPSQARGLLERCFRGMNQAGDRMGQLLAAAGVIETYYFEWATFRPMDKWIGAISQRLDPPPAFPSPEAELRVYSTLLIAMSYREPHHSLLPRLAQRTAQLLESEAEVNAKVTAGTFLLGYCYFASDYALGERILTLVLPLADDRELTPLNQLWWRARIVYYYWHLTEYDQALRSLQEALQIAEGQGFGGLRSAQPMLRYFESLVAFSRNDLAAADDCIRALARVVKPSRRMDLWYLHQERAVMALRQGDFATSLEQVTQALEGAVSIGMIYVEVLSRVSLAHILVRLERFDEAVTACTETRKLCDGSVLAHFDAELLLIEAYIALRRGQRSEALDLATRGLARARESGYVYYFRWVPETLPAVFAELLAAGIEVGYVREVIRRFGYAPPHASAKDWPRPLQLRALGGFALVQDAVKIEPGRRGTRKPLELLKAILALGGRDVDAGALAEWLWPDAEGDAAHKTLEITLHRLRKQLGNERVVTMRQGKVGIDAQLCWVDLLAFEQLARGTEALLRSEPDVVALQSGADTLLDLYRGDLLPQDTDLLWLTGPRERLRGRFLRLVGGLGQALENAGDHDRAIALYWRGVEIESTAEALYQRLMACYRETGRQTDGEDVYRRCVAALAGAAGQRPSAETESLYHALQSSHPH